MSTATSDLHGQARAWHKHLRQNTTWIPATGVPVRIAGMDPAWRHNAANWLLKRASSLAFLSSLAELHMDDEPIGTDPYGYAVYTRMPLEVEDDLIGETVERCADPEGWLKATRLYQALVKDLPDGIADLARHWSTCDLRTSKATVCSCWQRHDAECPVNQIRDITASCHCNDNSPEWTL